MTCNIYDDTGKQFNQNALPAASITVTFTVPDKVGVGGTVSGLVKMDPGPANGPIALKAGTATYAIDLAVTGATVGTVRATGGPNGAQIQPNSQTASPDMAFSVTASAAAGQAVTFAVKDVEVIATSPTKLITRCAPGGSEFGKVASVAVVAGTVEANQQLANATKSAGSSGKSSSGSGVKGASASNVASDGGYANCAAAKADGRGTIVKTDPKYAARLDGDSDGLACESGDPAVLGASLARTGSSTSQVLWVSVLLSASGVILLVASRRKSTRK